MSCRLKKFRISSALDDGRQLPASLTRHLEGCPDCQQFFENSQAINSRLSPTDYEAPGWLHTRVMAATRSDSESQAAPTPSPRWLPTLAGTAAIALAVAIVTVNIRQATTPETAGDKVAIGAVATPIHPASVPAHLEKHAKVTLGAEFNNIASDISDARKFLGASLRHTIPGLGN